MAETRVKDLRSKRSAVRAARKQPRSSDSSGAEQPLVFAPGASQSLVLTLILTSSFWGGCVGRRWAQKGVEERQRLDRRGGAHEQREAHVDGDGLDLERLSGGPGDGGLAGDDLATTRWGAVSSAKAHSGDGAWTASSLCQRWTFWGVEG